MADVGPVSTLTARTPLILSGDRLYIDDGAGGDFSVSLAVMAASVLASPTVTGHATIEGVTATGATGTGKLVFDGTPTLVTPVLGVATATSINKVVFTAPAASATLTIANTKTLTVSNTLTLAGTDSTTMTFPSTSATIARTDAANTFTGIQTFSTPIATASVATMTATVGGGVPTPPNNTTTFLRGDGTFAAPAGGGLTIGTTTITNGTTARLLYDNSGVVGESTVTTDGTSLTITSGSLTLTGNISVAAWTTAGLRYKGVAFSATDTSSSGLVAAAYTNLFGVGTILASSATTYTNYFNTYFNDPVASTNVTMTNKWALGADSLKVGTVFTVTTAGVISSDKINAANDITISGGHSLLFAGAGGAIHYGAGSYFQQVTDGVMQLTNNANNFGALNLGPNTLQLAWLAAANLRLGLAPNATPVANTLTIGEASRPATDSNVGGANGTVQSGLGTGTGTPSTLILQSALATTTGTGAHTYVTGMVVKVGTAVLTSYTVANLPAAGTAGAGATAFVTDASTTLILGLGGTVTGGGANKVPVFSDGTNWIYG